MGFVKKWPDEVREGVFKAVFEQGATVRAAAQAAVAGELPQLRAGDPRPPAAVGLPEGTVQDWCRHERRKRRRLEAARSAPEVVLGDTVARLVALHEADMSRAERKAARGQLKPGTLRDLAKDGQEIARLAAMTAKRGSGRQTGSEQGDTAPVQTGAGQSESTDGSWLEQLAEETATG